MNEFPQPPEHENPSALEQQLGVSLVPLAEAAEKERQARGAARLAEVDARIAAINAIEDPLKKHSAQVEAIDLALGRDPTAPRPPLIKSFTSDGVQLIVDGKLVPRPEPTTPDKTTPNEETTWHGPLMRDHDGNAYHIDSNGNPITTGNSVYRQW